MDKLVLFDIDGTLIDSAGAGRKSVNKAFSQLFSIYNVFDHVQMGGKTDIQIIREGLSAHGLPSTDGVIPSILSRYLENLRVEAGRGAMRIMPGVTELLGALKTMAGYWLGLLTGNIREGAMIKLGALGLSGYFPVGAFGDDDEDRNRLLPKAVSKFKAMTGIDIGYHDCIVIGDTPLDVRCSKPFGATSIVVSTGPFTYEALSETEADYVLKDLSMAAGLFN